MNKTPEPPSMFPEHRYRVDMHLQYQDKLYMLSRRYSGYTNPNELEYLWFVRLKGDYDYSREIKQDFPDFPKLEAGEEIQIIEFTIHVDLKG